MLGDLAMVVLLKKCHSSNWVLQSINEPMIYPTDLFAKLDEETSARVLKQSYLPLNFGSNVKVLSEYQECNA